MSASRVIASTKARNKVPVISIKEHRPSRASKVLAERNPAVVAVGAWVEEGEQDFTEHPNTLALLTEELQEEKRRQNEESLRRFQDQVRHRVAQQAQVCKRGPQTHRVVTPSSRIPHQHYRVWTHQESAGEKLMSPVQQSVMRSSQESNEGMRQVRLRLAACRKHEVMTSDLPGGQWNVSPTRHRDGSGVLSAEEVVLGEEEEEEEKGAALFLSGQHECPLVQQKVRGRTLMDADELYPDPGFKSHLGVQQPLWPLDNQEELKRQRQYQFMIHRRLAMNTEREQVKENKQHRKHLKRTARIKAEKEQIRLEEERRLERVRQLEEARQKLGERELLILERLKLEEEERALQLQRRRKQEKGKVTTRFVDALRAQVRERLSQAKLEPPPLCCCASSFWDSHPDTCANNCTFHNNPKAYAQALHSTMVSLDLQ
ncbi:coiled-coil domain-containing protein 15 [Parambassis ranga]|uniref:Coiled-coil domain-containing protein 15 n=1 Tax=Parambassis ranga TaxID=210632 RepID=A0A6P7JK84_9TELE|nr:coiled-coil domain-containing protein 15 [Parambassis ranga]